MTTTYAARREAPATARAPGAAGAAARNLDLQWLRALAATAVLLYHAAVYLQILRGDGRMLRFFDAYLGLAGVMVFFAISGYLMSVAMQRQSAYRFLLHRIARVYPPFFITTLLAFLLTRWTGSGFVLDWFSLTLMPYGAATYPLGVEWTLVFEIAFYVFVFALIRLRLQAAAVSILLGWLGIILASNLLFPEAGGTNVYAPYALPFVSVNTGFAFGMLIPLLPHPRIHPLLAVILSVNLVLLLGFTSLSAMRWGLGIGAAIVIVSLTARNGAPQRTTHSLLARLGARLGDYSYALYLCHVPLIRFVYTAAPQLAPGQAFAAALLAAFAGAVCIGMLDLRLYRFLKARVDRGSERFLRLASIGFLALFGAMTLYNSVMQLAQVRISSLHQDIAGEMAAQKALLTAADAQAVAGAAGLVASPQVLGVLDRVEWNPGGLLHVAGWVADRRPPHRPPFLGLFLDGRLLGIVEAGAVRPDVAASLDVPVLNEQPSGFSAEFAGECRPGHELVAMVITDDRRFSLPHAAQPLRCGP